MKSEQLKLTVLYKRSAGSWPMALNFSYIFLNIWIVTFLRAGPYYVYTLLGTGLRAGCSSFVIEVFYDFFRT